MGRKKKRIKPVLFCYYCDRLFDNERVLIQHQRAKHFKCPQCRKTMSTAHGMMVHVFQVHKDTIDKVPSAKEGRDSFDKDVYGMDGVPTELIEEKRIKIYGECSNKKFKANIQGPMSSQIPLWQGVNIPQAGMSQGLLRMPMPYPMPLPPQMIPQLQLPPIPSIVAPVTAPSVIPSQAGPLSKKLLLVAKNTTQVQNTTFQAPCFAQPPPPPGNFHGAGPPRLPTPIIPPNKPFPEMPPLPSEHIAVFEQPVFTRTVSQLMTPILMYGEENTSQEENRAMHPKYANITNKSPSLSEFMETHLTSVQ